MSELVSRGDFTKAVPEPDRLTVLERRYYEVLARLTALEAKVWAQAPKVVPVASNEATEASRKALAEAEEKALGTAVDIAPEDWERGWLNL